MKKKSTQTKSTTGTKYDEGKPDLTLLSPIAMIQISRVMEYGAKKYTRNNWRKGFKYSRVLAAVLRHLFSWMGGERVDPETGYSHLAHASCGLMFLLEFEKTGAGEDDLKENQTI